MSCEADGAEVYLYVISSSRLERAKIGVAGDAEKRLRELQVGSPVELKLELSRAYAERRDAVAVVAEVREALATPATREAPARARAAAAAAAQERRVAPRRGEQPRARTQKQL